jgi:hypothetical protein
MTRANGSFDFLSNECVVGMAFSVDRTYLGGQFASGDGVTLDCNIEINTSLSDVYHTLTFGGKMMGGGGSSNSATLKG